VTPDGKSRAAFLETIKGLDKALASKYRLSYRDGPRQLGGIKQFNAAIILLDRDLMEAADQARAVARALARRLSGLSTSVSTAQIRLLHARWSDLNSLQATFSTLSSANAVVVFVIVLVGLIMSREQAGSVGILRLWGTSAATILAGRILAGLVVFVLAAGVGVIASAPTGDIADALGHLVGIMGWLAIAVQIGFVAPTMMAFFPESR